MGSVDPVLREHGHGRGRCCMAYFARGEEVVLATTGQDGRVKIWNPEGKLLRQSDEIDCDGPCYSISIRPDGEVIAVGTETSVNLFKADESMEFIHTAATFQFSVRNIMFNPEGDQLVAASDDSSISIINVDETAESTLAYSVPVGANLRSVAWDPSGTYLALAQSNGYVHILDTSTREVVWKEGLAPEIPVDSPLNLQTSWHPLEGRSLAVPTNKRTGDVTIWQRMNWGRESGSTTLTGAHADAVCANTFSPNGRYMATSAADKQIVVWDVSSSPPNVLAKHTLPDKAVSIGWHPSANEIAATMLNGSMVGWQNVVPSHLVPPHHIVSEPKPNEGMLLPTSPDANGTSVNLQAALKHRCLVTVGFGAWIGLYHSVADKIKGKSGINTSKHAIESTRIVTKYRLCFLLEPWANHMG